MNSTMKNASEIQAYRLWYIRNKARQLMSIQGDSGIAVKTALFSGLREEEMIYSYSQQICLNDSCKCNNLHIITKLNGISIVGLNWVRKAKRCYFTILPTTLWDRFRSLVPFDSSNIAKANIVVKQSAGINFEQLRKIYFQVMCTTMEKSEIQVLTGKASLEAASECMSKKLNMMADKYYKAWEKFGVILTRT